MSRVLKAPEVVLDQGGKGQTAVSAAFQAAIEDAFNRGREAGAAEATAQLETQVVRLRDELATMLTQARSIVADQVGVDADTLVDLSFDLASWFLDDVALGDPEALSKSLQPALKQLIDETGLVIYLHPAVAERLGDIGVPGASSVRSDPTLDPGDFRLTSDGATVERRWRDALAGLRPELCAALRQAASAQDHAPVGDHDDE
jgi:flagellar biosynthesis/type III secretory pathway protein FliH